MRKKNIVRTKMARARTVSTKTARARSAPTRTTPDKARGARTPRQLDWVVAVLLSAVWAAAAAVLASIDVSFAATFAVSAAVLTFSGRLIDRPGVYLPMALLAGLLSPLPALTLGQRLLVFAVMGAVFEAVRGLGARPPAAAFVAVLALPPVFWLLSGATPELLLGAANLLLIAAVAATVGAAAGHLLWVVVRARRSVVEFRYWRPGTA